MITDHWITLCNQQHHKALMTDRIIQKALLGSFKIVFKKSLYLRNHNHLKCLNFTKTFKKASMTIRIIQKLTSKTINYIRIITKKLQLRCIHYPWPVNHQASTLPPLKTLHRPKLHASRNPRSHPICQSTNVTSALNPTHEWMKRPIVLKMLANAGRASEVGKEVGNKNVKGTAFNMKYLREPPSSTNADKNKKSGLRWNGRSGDKRKGRKMIFLFHGFYFSISLNNVWKVIFLKWAIYRNSFPFQVVSTMNLIFRFEKHLLLRRRCEALCRPARWTVNAQPFHSKA